MGKEIIIRGATRFYEENFMIPENGQIGIEELLYHIPDDSTSAKFSIDRLINSAHGLTYRNKSNQSVIRHFEPGTNTLVPVPIASEKTPIDEELEDVVAAGQEATDSQMDNLMANVENIVKDHAAGHRMTKAYQAIRTKGYGLFPASGVKGADLGLGHDHNRDVANSITYDFTAGGATMNEALLDISDLMDSINAPLEGRAVLMGANWRSAYGSDSEILESMKANGANQILEQTLFNQNFGNVKGLSVIAQYRPRGASAPLWLLSYQPGTQYIAYEGAAGVPFVDVNTALFWSLVDPSYNVKRGVSVFNEEGEKERVIGDMAFDSFEENEPMVTWIRSWARHIYIEGNTDHTGLSVGTFV